MSTYSELSPTCPFAVSRVRLSVDFAALVGILVSTAKDFPPSLRLLTLLLGVRPSEARGELSSSDASESLTVGFDMGFFRGRRLFFETSGGFAASELAAGVSGKSDDEGDDVARAGAKLEAGGSGLRTASAFLLKNGVSEPKPPEGDTERERERRRDGVGVLCFPFWADDACFPFWGGDACLALLVLFGTAAKNGCSWVRNKTVLEGWEGAYMRRVWLAVNGLGLHLKATRRYAR